MLRLLERRAILPPRAIFRPAPSLSEVMLLGRGASGMAMEVHPGALI